MASCMICKKQVTTGLVLCGDCAHKLELFTLPPELAYFIDQLAGDIVADETSYPCNMCSIEVCSGESDALTCKNGVKAWLLSKVNQYLSAANMFEQGEQL